MAISIITQVDIVGDHFQIHSVGNTSGDESRGLYSRKAALQPDPRKFGCCAALRYLKLQARRPASDEIGTYGC